MEALLPFNGCPSTSDDESREASLQVASDSIAGALGRLRNAKTAEEAEKEARVSGKRIRGAYFGEGITRRSSSAEKSLQEWVPSSLDHSRRRRDTLSYSEGEESFGRRVGRRKYAEALQAALNAKYDPESQRHWGAAALHGRPPTDTPSDRAVVRETRAGKRAATAGKGARGRGRIATPDAFRTEDTVASAASLRPPYSFARQPLVFNTPGEISRARTRAEAAEEKSAEDSKETDKGQAADSDKDDGQQKVEAHLWVQEQQEGVITERTAVAKRPISAARLLKLIETGVFNGRGKEVFYRRLGMLPPEKSRPLSDALPAVLREAALQLQQQIAPKKRKPARDMLEQQVEIVEEPPMQFGPSVSSAESFFTLEKIREHFGTCDMMVWLVPPTTPEHEWLQPPAEQQEDMLAQYIAEAWPWPRGGRAPPPRTTPLKIYKIPVHAALMRISSPVWLSEIAALEDKRRMRIRYQTPPERDVLLNYELPTAYPEGVRYILQTIYGHRRIKGDIDPFLLIQIYKEAWRWKMDQLCREVLRHLARPMQVEYFVTLAHAAEAMRARDLLRCCVRVIADCAFAAFAGLYYLQLGPEGMRLLLQQDTLQLDEIQVYLCASAWLNEQSAYFYETEEQEDLFAGVELTSDHREDYLARDIFRCIRFDSMSPSQIETCREPSRESVLLDACLRKFAHAESRPRVFPWNENGQFTAQKNGGLFPVVISRVRSDRSNAPGSPALGISFADASFVDAVTAASLSPRWAWTLGDGRLVNEAFWAAEIIHTKRGALRFGVATEDRTTNARLVCYFDYEAHGFVTGTITGDPEIVAYRTLQGKGNTKWNRRLFKGDVVATRLSVVPKALHISLKLLQNEDLHASFTLPLRTSVVYLDSVLRRPFLTIWPFLEACDEGDTVGVPDIHTTALHVM